MVYENTGNDPDLRIWRICPVGPGHVWQADDTDQAEGAGCPCCAGSHPSAADFVASRSTLSRQDGPVPSFIRRG